MKLQINLLPFLFCLALCLGAFLCSGGSLWAVGWAFFGWLCFVIVVELITTVNQKR